MVWGEGTTAAQRIDSMERCSVSAGDDCMDTSGIECTLMPSPANDVMERDLWGSGKMAGGFRIVWMAWSRSVARSCRLPITDTDDAFRIRGNAATSLSRCVANSLVSFTADM